MRRPAVTSLFDVRLRRDQHAGFTMVNSGKSSVAKPHEQELLSLKIHRLKSTGTISVMTSMLNQSHHGAREATVTRCARMTRARQHPEKPHVRPTSPVL